MISLGNIYTSFIIQTEPATFRNIYVHTYIHVTTISEKRGNKFEGGLERFGGKEGKGESCNYIIVSKIKWFLISVEELKKPLGCRSHQQ